MEAEIIQLGRTCRHGAPIAKCATCTAEKEVVKLKDIRDQLSNANDVLSEQNMFMWHALDEMASGRVAPSDVVELAKSVVLEMAEGQLIRGRLT